MPKNKENSAVFQVHAIPAEFYAGANPVIKFKTTEKEVDLSKEIPTAAEKKMLDKATVVGGEKKLHPANFLANTKFLVVGGIIIFILFVLGIGLYYWLQLRKSARESYIPPPQQTTTPAQNITVPTTTEESTVTPEVVATSTVEQPEIITEVSMDFPSNFLSNSLDSDADDLTDLAEELYGTDPFKPDTDEDGYGDGHEVFNLYDPAEQTPQKIIDSENIIDFTNPIFGYSVYYPSSWALGNVDSEYRDVLFSTITGENIEIRVFDMLPGQSFSDWFAENATKQSVANLADFSSVFRESGRRRDDYLVYYFISGNKMIVMAYHTTDSNILNYRSVVKMMARSFRLTGNDSVVPEQIEEGANNAVEGAESEAPLSEIGNNTTTPTTSSQIYDTGAF